MAHNLLFQSYTTLIIGNEKNMLFCLLFSYCKHVGMYITLTSLHFWNGIFQVLKDAMFLVENMDVS